MTALSRRHFVQGMGVASFGLLGGCGRLPEQAQPTRPQPARVHRIGLLVPGVSDSPRDWARIEPFRQGLTELGYIEGANLDIKYRFAEGEPERLSVLAEDLVRLEVEVIFALGPLAAPAAKHATNTIPIIFAYVGDPVTTGLVASLARPGGNVTGLSNLNEGLSAKRLQLLAESLPGISRVAVVWNPQVLSNAADIRETQAAADMLKLQLVSLEIQEPSDFDGALEVLLRERAEAIIWLGDVVTASRISQFVRRTRLPAMSRLRGALDDEMLMLYAPNPENMLRRAAIYVDRVLRGANPADLPVEQPTTFDFVINLKTAQALGLTIPPHVLAQATEIIQ